MAKKKTRRPARAQRRSEVAGGRVRPVAARSASPAEVPELPGLLKPQVGWLRFMPPSAADILDAERPVAELFGKVPAEEPMWTWQDDLDEASTEDLVRGHYPHLNGDEVAMLAADWDTEAEEYRAEERRRFTTLCNALGVPEPEGTVADLYRFCQQIGLAAEREVNGELWVVPTPHARDVLDILPPGSALADGERAGREREAAEQAWMAAWMTYGEYTDRIISLFGDGDSGGPVTTSLQRLARKLEVPEDTARRALAHLVSPNPVSGRAHMSCTADPLTVPAHRVITVALDREARDLDTGLTRTPEQLTGLECIACGTDYPQHPDRPQVTAGRLGASSGPDLLVACQGTCAADYGGATGTGQPVPPIEDRIAHLKQLSAAS